MDIFKQGGPSVLKSSDTIVLKWLIKKYIRSDPYYRRRGSKAKRFENVPDKLAEDGHVDVLGDEDQNEPIS